MNQFHFIAGLPRSGSTLLAAILRQNPSIMASMSSPVGTIFSAMQRQVSGGTEGAVFLDDAQRQRLLGGVFVSYYGDVEIALDTNRVWPSKLDTLTTLFPECKVVCCVRPVNEIADSVERLIRKHPLQSSGIFGYEPGNTVYSRIQTLMSDGGLIGSALNALKDGFHNHPDRLLFVEYEALAKHPSHTVRAVYEWLGLSAFEHDYENIEQIPSAAEFDARLGTPGLHHVGQRVEWREQKLCLPPDIVFPAPFWRANNPNVPVIHCEMPQRAELVFAPQG